MHHFEVQPENNKFKVIFVDLTHKCNMHCSNCYIPNRHIPDMDKTSLMTFARRIPNKVTFRLIGGEPTLREDLPEIVAELTKLGHKTTLFTNGLRLSDNNLVKELKLAGLNRVQLSLNGGAVGSIYKMVDGQNVLDKKLLAFKNLMSNQLIVSLGMIVCSETISGPAIRSIISLIEDVYEAHAACKNKFIYIPSLRFRSIGKVGRYMNNELEFNELVDIVSRNLSISKASLRYAQCGIDFFRDASAAHETRSVKSIYQSRIGPIHFKITDWKVDDDGVIEAQNNNRGRITKEWTLAPFFEDIKKNEFGY